MSYVFGLGKAFQQPKSSSTLADKYVRQPTLDDSIVFDCLQICDGIILLLLTKWVGALDA